MSHICYPIDSDPYFEINPVTRSIKNLGEKIAVSQYDHNSERFTFSIPSVVEGHAMPKVNKIEIHYVNISTYSKETVVGVYTVDDMTETEDDKVTFSWVLSRNATAQAGTLEFIVRFICLSEDDEVKYCWNTAKFSGITILESIDNGEDFVEQYSDVLEEWRGKLLDSYADIETALDKVIAKQDNIIAEQEAIIKIQNSVLGGGSV